MLDKIIKSRRDYTIIKIIVSPNAKKDEIIGLNRWRKGLNLKIREKPIQDRGNRAVLKFFTDLFSLKSDDVKIIKGEKSREKIIMVKIKKSETIDILEGMLSLSKEKISYKNKKI